MSTSTPPATIQPVCYGAEVTAPHTRLLRISLVLEESRAYWENLRLDISKEQRPTVAFEERWFSNKSMDRVRRLLAEFSHRYDAYPVALAVLMKWQAVDPITRQNLCHWHLQLTDPLYRQFTGEFLEQRRHQKNASIDRDIVARWVTSQIKSDWSVATTQRMATGLIAAAAAADLCSNSVGHRSLTYPKVTDDALSYWLYFLRYLSFEGTLLENPYLASVGLTEGFLEQRLRRLPSLAFNRMGELYEFGWKYSGLEAWASHSIESFEVSER